MASTVAIMAKQQQQLRGRDSVGGSGKNLLIGRNSLGGSKMRKESIQFGEGVSQPPAIDQERWQRILESYQEAMRKNAEGEINASNAFNTNFLTNFRAIFASFQGSFPKAGSAVEVSANIYEKRVDSLHQDALRIQEQISRSDTSKRKKDDGTTDEDEEELGEDEGGDKNENDTRKAKRTKVANTEKSFLISKEKLDMPPKREIRLDPASNKMNNALSSAETMFLNTFSVVKGCSLTMDYNSIPAFPSINEDHDDEVEEENRRSIDLSLFAKGPVKDICPTFRLYRGRLEGKSDAEVQDADKSDWRASKYQYNNEEVDNQEYEDDGYDGPGGNDNYDYSNSYDDEVDDHQHSSSTLFTTSNNNNNNHISEETAIIIPMQNAKTAKLVLTGADNEYEYFSINQGISSLGHWKFAGKNNNIKSSAGAQVSSNNVAKGSKRAGASQAAMSTNAKKKSTVDFYTPVDPSVLFAPPKSLKTLIQTMSNKSSTTFLLPTDFHLKPRDFERLFLKPNRKLLVVKEEEEQKQQQHQAQSLSVASNVYEDDGYVYEDGGPNFYDNDDDEIHSPKTQEIAVSSLGVKQHELIADVRKVQQIAIKHAVTAKRVDVKKLKSEMWDEIQSELNEKKQEKLSFKDLAFTMKPKVASNITVPFYFICALHLANEQNLVLTTHENLCDLDIRHE